MDSTSQNDARSWQVAGVVSFYMSAALVMVFVNKAVLNSSPDLPLLFLLIQLVLAVVLLHAAAAISPKVEIPKFEMKNAKKLVPVTLVNVIGLVFNILCLRGVEASFFQIARGLVLPITIAVSCPVWHEAPSRISIIYGVLSSFFIALHAVLIKISLPHAHNSTIQLAYWQNLGSVLFLAPFIVVQGEYGKFKSLLGTPGWNAEVFVWGSIVTGVFGFLLCVAGLLSIKVTSPITHMFSSAARSAIQTLLGVWLFNDLLTANRATSILVIALGTMFYTWVKSIESAQPPRVSPLKDDVEAGTFRRDDSEATLYDWQDEKKVAED
ncbi:GDP-fucose transporter 1 [Grifola frondosa]|uniref:GDP-mannose transporter n=1 Tax=Grifola frondosa TaxID=5627 RepID=A0A1C7MP84_GRIFR|nr:GDP-fucose transporter 1 [Grifola frondosa]